VLFLPMGILLVFGAMSLDIPLAHFFHYHQIRHWIDDYQYSPWGWYVGRVMRQPGEWWPTVFCAVFLLFFHSQGWRAGGFMLLAFVPGAINGVLKWVAGRHRPYTGREAWDWNFFQDGWWGLFHQKNLSFASGHATLAFAWATAMSLAYPRFRVVFFSIAGICGLQRVLSADHYLTDVLAAAVLGVVTVKAMFRILSRVIPQSHKGLENVTTCLPEDRTRNDDRSFSNDPSTRHLPVPGHSLLQ
jgi:membrane-associated phospholipid phosphatase